MAYVANKASKGKHPQLLLSMDHAGGLACYVPLAAYIHYIIAC